MEHQRTVWWDSYPSFDIIYVMFLRSVDRRPEATHVLAALTNENDRRILAVTQEEPVEASTLLDEADVAKSTLYRRLDRLERQRLLCVEQRKLRNGNVVDLYRSTLSSLTLEVRDGCVQVSWDADEPENGLDDQVVYPEPTGSSEAKADVS